MLFYDLRIRNDIYITFIYSVKAKCFFFFFLLLFFFFFFFFFFLFLFFMAGDNCILPGNKKSPEVIIHSKDLSLKIKHTD